MPAYGVPQAGANVTSNQGKNLTSLDTGQQIVLWDGTETPALGAKSVAFANAYPPNGPIPITFNLTNIPADMLVDIQVAANDTEAEYTSIATLSPSTTPDTGNAAYTDPGRSSFYRLYISAFVTAQMPKAKATR